MPDRDADLTKTDPVIDLGQRVLHILAEGYDGEQITKMGFTVDEAEAALHAYAARVLHGTAPTMPSPDCGGGGYDGWCFVHGVFHVASG